MERKMKILHSMDNFAILFSIAAAWGTILLILINVIALSESSLFSIIALLSAFSVLVTLSVTSLALILHLKKNRTELYEEDIKQMKKFREAARV